MWVSQIIGPRTSEVIEAQDPEPWDHEVLVEVLASGVCTSDLTLWRNGGAPGDPIRLGHEIVGRVVTAGREAGRWLPGDVVTGLGDRGFASHAVMNAAHILPVPDRVEPWLALGEPVADLAEALSRTGMVSGDRVAVVGLGFMGLGLVQLVKDRAPGLLIGVDPMPAARARALALGADLAFAPGEVPAEYCSGPGKAADARAGIVLEATGVTPGLRTAGSLVRPFGTLCVVGYHHAGDAPMDMDLWYKAVTIVNGFCPDKMRLMGAMRQVLDLIAARRFSYQPLVTHRFGLGDVDQAYALMEAREEGFVKAVLTP